MSNGFKYEDKRKKEKLVTNYSTHAVFSEQGFNNYLKTNIYSRDFDRETFQKGIDWFNSGFSMDEAPSDLANNIYFKNGFIHGKRMALIEEYKSGRKK